MKLHQAGRLDEARVLYERALALRPKDPDALHYFGVLRHDLGDPCAGVALIERSLRIAPRNAYAWLNLGNMLLELERTLNARAAYERAAALAPRMADAWYNLGVCLRKMQDANTAIAAFDRALELRGEHAPSHYQRGIARREAGDLTAAEADYRAALQQKPRYFEVYESLGMLLYRQGRNDDAAAVYRAWLAQDPNSSTAKHLTAAMSGANAPERAPDDYVTETFDRFAATFEQNLANLEYRAPEMVAAALAQNVARDRPLSRVLDAGCGTGLCGPLLRPLTGYLAGVDLSPGMIERARLKGCYDELYVGELGGFMDARSGQFDAVVAADTLVYFGALEAVFASTAACLKAGGLLVATLEKMPAEAGQDLRDQNYRIEPHGRYSHRLEYVSAALAQATMQLLVVAEQVLRRERGEDVRGLVVTAQT